MGKRKGTIAVPKGSPKESPTKQAKMTEGDYVKELAERKKATLHLADGTSWTGYSFGADTSVNGEVRSCLFVVEGSEDYGEKFRCCDSAIVLFNTLEA